MIEQRTFLKNAMAAGTGALFTTARARAAEAPPETTRVRLFKFPGICLAPTYIAEDLLRAEGFTDVQYLESPKGFLDLYDRLASARSISPSGTAFRSSRRSTRGDRSCSWPASTRDATSSSPRHASRRFVISRTGRSPCRTGARRPRSWPPCWPTSASITARTCISSSTPRRIHRAPGRGKDRRGHGHSADQSGAPREKDRPRGGGDRRRSSLVAVFLLHARGQQGLRPESTRWRRSVYCARSSRPINSAPRSPSAWRAPSSTEGSRSVTTMRSRR